MKCNEADSDSYFALNDIFIQANIDLPQMWIGSSYSLFSCHLLTTQETFSFFSLLKERNTFCIAVLKTNVLPLAQGETQP